MGFFGKTEAELKEMARELEQQKNDLLNQTSDLKSQRENLDHEKKLLEDKQSRLNKESEAFLANTRNEHECLEAKKAELDSRRIELASLEAVAKVGFAESQLEVFKEVIEKRIAELDARQHELNGLQESLAARLRELNSREGEIARRELEVTDREQRADAGFADRARILAEEAARQHQANQAEGDRLRVCAEELARRQQEIENEKATLNKREQEIVKAEQIRDAGFADERKGLNDELHCLRSKFESEITVAREERLLAIENEIVSIRTRRLEEVTRLEQEERNRIQNLIACEKEAWKKHQDEARKKYETELTEFEKQKGALSAQRSELEGRRTELEANERLLELRQQRIEDEFSRRNEEFEDLIAERLGEERKSINDERESFRSENNRLREGLRIQTDLLGVFEQLKWQLGDRDPAAILEELNRKTEELCRLREELISRPTEEMRARNREIEAESQRQKARIVELEQQINENASIISESMELRRKNSELTADNQSNKKRAEIFEAAANQAQSELKRLRDAYERPAEVEARYKEIEMPHFIAEKTKQPPKAEIDELTWLTGVGNACNAYGLHFNTRILKAFHTSLKTSEWSPLTILAGVSGTGKSELPRLYSHFGGLLFEPLSVQPNWDSQESMLGFFNSIDNKFDAQPVLRLLAQSQKKWEVDENGEVVYPGLADAVCLILLDEMNLAHPELYFAEFLSKLELRRGMKGSDVPSLPVKIGAGMPPYQLPLGRNVLWAGTMNQDETTKSLSDKVLDRSIIIHFPRPTELKRRLKLSPLDEKNRGPLLHKTSWQNWLAIGSSFADDDVKPFKLFIEEMNRNLSEAGRAIGHRVWQSVEYYMANYPDVRAAQNREDKNELANALHLAFEDQLVQKVMPKLRGIDTRGKSKTECLDKIRGQINTGVCGRPFNLTEDFDLACELGYGQFIWQSANYLKEEPIVQQDENLTLVNESESPKKRSRRTKNEIA